MTPAKPELPVIPIILTVLRARGVTCSAEGLGRLEACVDPGVLNQWLMRALQAASEAEVFGA